MQKDKNMAVHRVNRTLDNLRLFGLCCDVLSPEERRKAIKALEDGMRNLRRINKEINRADSRTDKSFKLEA